MNGAHYHLLVNHLPIVLPTVGLFILMAGYLFKSEIVKRVAYFVFVAGAAFTLIALETGEGAEEVVEHLEGVTKKLIHEHEEQAETFALLSYILGAASLLAAWASWKNKSYSRILGALIMAFTLVVLFFATTTGTTGGEIRHTEIRKNSVLHQDSTGTK